MNLFFSLELDLPQSKAYYEPNHPQNIQNISQIASSEETK